MMEIDYSNWIVVTAFWVSFTGAIIFAILTGFWMYCTISRKKKEEKEKEKQANEK